MKNKLNVLIVEDEDADVNALTAEINANADKLCLVGKFKSASKAFDFIRNNTPHAVILDLELQKGSGDGLALLEKLHETLIYPRPYIVLNTLNSSQTTRIKAKKLGADYEFAKWQSGYKHKMVIDHLLSVMPEILGCEEAPRTRLDEQQLENRMRDYLHEEFNQLGLKLKNKGYDYLVEAVLLAVKDEMQDWGKIIGAKFKKSKDSVVHDMKYEIDRAWTHGDTTNLDKHYTATMGSNQDAPTTLDFVLFYKQQLIKHFR